MLRVLVCILLVIALFPARADFEKGVAAYQEGDFETAFAEFEKLANLGIVVAQTNLGYMYDEGRTVKQDFVESYKWFLLAAERGREGAEGHLKLLEAEYMTPEQVETAKARAAEWQPKPEKPAE